MRRKAEQKTKLTSFFALKPQVVAPIVAPAPPSELAQPTLRRDVIYSAEDFRKRNAFEILKQSAKKTKRQPADMIDHAKRREQMAIENNFKQSLVLYRFKERTDQLHSIMQELLNDEHLPYINSLSSERRACPGKGAVNANLVVIFLKPTNEEIRTGKSFTSGYATTVQNIFRRNQIEHTEHCYFTYLFKIAPTVKNPSYEDIDHYLYYLFKELDCLKPKHIVCFGDVLSTLAREHFQLSKRLRGPEINDEMHIFKTQRFWTTAMTQSVHFKFGLVARVSCMKDVKYYMDLKDKLGSGRQRAAWLEEFATLRSKLFLPALQPNDVIGELEQYYAQKNTTLRRVANEMGVTFRKSKFNYFSRADFHSVELPENYAETVPSVRLYLTQCLYDKTNSQFTLFGRTPEGFSCALHVHSPRFRFWLHHGSFEYIVNQKGKIDYSPPDVTKLQEEMDRLLVSNYKSNWKFKNSTAEEILDFLGVKLEYVLKRPYLYYHRERIRFLQIEYSHTYVLPIVKEILSHLFPGNSLYESRTKPNDFFFYDRDLYMYGWIELPSILLEEVTPMTICDIEYATHYQNIRGLSPNSGQSTDPINESHSCLRFLNFDCEMLSSTDDRMPVPDTDPIVRICCTLTDLNSTKTPPLFEVRRHPKAHIDREAYARKPHKPFRADRQTKETGNTNVLHRVEFVLGVHESPTAELFSSTVLPFIPVTPKQQLSPAENAGTVPFLEAVYAWNQFIDSVFKWIQWVGVYRATRLLNDTDLVELFIEKRISKLPKKDESDVSAYNRWKDTIIQLDAKWNLKTLHYTAIDSEEHQPPPELVDEVSVGTIQYRWKLFYPTPIAFFYDNEKQMLVDFAEYVRIVDVDVFLGHNICGFDLPYIIRRIQTLNLHWKHYIPEYGIAKVSLGRARFTIDYEPPSFQHDTAQTKRLETKANGARIFTIVDVPGRDTLDTLHYAQKDVADLHGFDLSSVADETVGDTKHDVPHTSIRPLFFNNPKKLTDYCLQDEELCNRIVNYRNALHYVVSTCRLLGNMSIGQYYTTGVQIKIVHKLIRRLRNSGLSKIIADVNIHSIGESVIDYDIDFEEEIEEEIKDDESALKKQSYTGATVIETLAGLYYQPIPTFDFSQLYPSIMIEVNLSHNSMGTLAWMLSQKIDESQLFCSGLEFPDPLNNNQPTKYYSLKRRELTLAEAEQLPQFDDQPAGVAQCRKNENGTYTPNLDIGDLVAVLWEVLGARGIVKNKMKGLHSSSEEYKKYDAQQLGLKVIANSTYGATGVSSGLLAAQYIGAAVTKFGREQLFIVKTLLEKYFGATIVGGDTDSVFSKFDQVKQPNDIYAVVEMHSNIKDQTSPLVKKPFIQHVLDAIAASVSKTTKMIFEKIYLGMVFECKKRAVGGVLMPTRNPATGKEEFEDGGKPKYSEKGTEGKRRSTAPFGARTFRRVGKILVKHYTDIPKMKRKIIDLVRGTVDDVLNGRIDESEFVMTRYYAKTDYANECNAVVQLCKLYQERGQPVPELGTRLKFVVISAPKGTKFYQKVEDPIYALKKNLKLDYNYYIEKHLRKPITRLTNVFDPSMEREMFGNLNHVGINLLESDPIYRHVQVHQRCEFCQQPSEQNYICTACSSMLSREQQRTELQSRTVAAIEDFECKKTQCYTCVGVEPGSDIECVNVRCKQFAPRKRAEFVVARYRQIQVKFDETA
jgi:uracil-DNA glycosylase family 4